MQKKKIVHIHSDLKFIKDNLKYFQFDYFENHLVVLNDKFVEENAITKEGVVFSKNNIKGIVNFCKHADLVVLYNLTIPKCKIALALPQEVKIAWRFFGAELYSSKKELVYSKQTMFYFAESRLKTLLRPYYQRIKYGYVFSTLFKKAVDQIDFMFVLSQEEYNFLIKYWGQLPEFVKLPHKAPEVVKLPDNMIQKLNKGTIIIGNNRSAFNNHLDVLSIINQNEERARKYNFMLLFNYGSENSYTAAVRRAVIGKTYFELIEDFMPKNEFMALYSTVNALVINGYRQMAGANIFLALQNGVKVYLNHDNAHYKWLVKEGLMVFSMKNFKEDLNNNKLYLSREEAQQSLELYKRFSRRYNRLDFQKIIYKKLV